MKKYIVQINGIYDILCSLCILNIIHIPYLNNLHLSMFKNNEYDPIFARFLSYWIFTYGIIRVFSNGNLISLSYLIEAIFFINECLHDTIILSKGIFVIIFSLILSYITYGNNSENSENSESIKIKEN
jgi:hypothetical protein